MEAKTTVTVAVTAHFKEQLGRNRQETLPIVLTILNVDNFCWYKVATECNGREGQKLYLFTTTEPPGQSEVAPSVTLKGKGGTPWIP